MGFWSDLFGDGEKKTGNSEHQSSLEGSLRSEKTLKMSALMENADGRRSLKRENQTLFSNCEPWEKLVLAALACQRAAKVMHESFSGKNNDQYAAAQGLALAANIIDGITGYEDNVPTFRNAPNNIDSTDWDNVARQAALGWANDVHDLLDTAKKIKG